MIAERADISVQVRPFAVHFAPEHVPMQEVLLRIVQSNPQGKQIGQMDQNIQASAVKRIPHGDSSTDRIQETGAVSGPRRLIG